MDSKAVSPLIGFVLLLAIIMGFIGIVQSSWVPEWNKAVEAKHLDEVSYEVAELSEAVSLAASTGNPAKVVIDAGVKYPEYYILLSPSKAAGSVGKRELWVNISGTVDSTPYSKNFTTYAITYKPNYLYSSSPELVFEHSAIFKVENSYLVVNSDQSSFTRSKITIYLINATFNPFSTTENVNLVFYPVSYGGSTRFSGTIEFVCYDERTASWWNETLSSIYGSDNVTQGGRKITLNVNNVELSINYFVATATSAGEVEVASETSPAGLQPLSESSYTVYEGTTVPLGVRVVDEFNNPVRNVAVSVTDSCHTTTTKTADDNGEVWYYFNADNIGSCDVTFTIATVSLGYSVNVNPPPTGGSGCIYNAYWMEGDSLTWNVSQEGASKTLNFKVMYGSDPVYNAQVYFAVDNTSVVSASNYEDKTDPSGVAQIALTALANGDVSVIGTVASCTDVINLTVEGVGAVNHPPNQPSLTTDKDRYYSGETITATASGSTDPDGDPITYYYKFYDDTASVILQDWSTDNTYTVTAAEEGHIIRVYAKACDDKGACSASVSRDVGVITVVTFNPTDDTFADQLYPNSNFGSESYLLVDSLSLWKDRTFVKFDVSSLPAGAHVVNATLQLYVYDTRAKNRNYGAHLVQNDWSEDTLTWNNQPGFSSTATDTVKVDEGWLSWNVTTDVRGFISGNPNYGWCIKDENENTHNTRYTYMYSKESGSNIPRLIVWYSPI
ncbi:DNRLRE domain-containing protein [Archaeoglobus sp.]